MRRIGGDVVHRAEPSRMLRLFNLIEPTAVATAHKMKVKPTLDAAG